MPPPAIRFADLFCGIGGFRHAMLAAAAKRGGEATGVFASDIDAACRRAYAENFGHEPVGDITRTPAESVPDHDLLLAGFPCQPFSIIGQKRGFEDTRGTLFFDIARILAAKKPRLFVLENVRQLVGHDRGRTLQVILKTLRDLGYQTDFRVLDALDFGLPQRRRRVWIVGSLDRLTMTWPAGGVPMTPLSRILEKNVPARFFASETIRAARLEKKTPGAEPAIWHENKSGNIGVHPYSCSLRAGASYNYLLVNGERRLTPREMLRLQGFPESFRIVCSDSQTRKQAGNSLPVTVAEHVIGALLDSTFPPPGSSLAKG